MLDLVASIFRGPVHIAVSPRCTRLVCDFCSSDRSFAFGFLQTPGRPGNPCRLASGSHRQRPQRTCTSKSTGPPPQRPGQRQSRRFAPCLAHNAKGPAVARPLLELPDLAGRERDAFRFPSHASDPFADEKATFDQAAQLVKRGGWVGVATDGYTADYEAHASVS